MAGSVEEGCWGNLRQGTEKHVFFILILQEEPIDSSSDHLFGNWTPFNKKGLWQAITKVPMSTQKFGQYFSAKQC